jgi:uncharacterized protein (TIRG00374 family)
VSEPERDEHKQLFGVDKRKALLGVGLALVLSLAAVAVIGQVTSYGKLRDAITHANKAWLPLCLVGELISYGGYVVAYRSVAAADGGPRLRLRDAARVVAIGLGAYVVGSGAGGLTVDFWAMRTAGAHTHEAARRTLALNTLQAWGLAIFAVTAALWLVAFAATSHAALVMAIVWLALVPGAFLGAVVASDPRIAPRLLDAPDDEERPSRLDLARWRHWLRAKLRKAFADAIGGVVFVRHVLGHPWRYVGGVVGYPLFWLGDFFILWVALHAFGYDLSPPRLVVAEASAWALSFLPLPAGGSGLAETTIAYTLHAVGVPLSVALFAALTYRAINFWLPLLPALALLPQVRSLQESLQETERAGPDEDAAIHQSA